MEFLNIFNIFFGWLLGISGTMVLSGITTKKHRNEIGKGILLELRELMQVLGNLALVYKMRHAGLDEDFLEWFTREIEYESVIGDDVDLIRKLIETHNASQLNLISKESGAGERSTMAVEYRMPYLESRTGRFDLFDEHFQRSLWRIRKELDVFNDKVRWVVKTIDFTFSQQDAGGMQALRSNEDIGNRHIESAAEDIAKLISDLIANYGRLYGVKLKSK